MRRLLIYLFSVALLTGMLTGCLQQKEDQKDTSGYTFVDDLGREITVDSPKRVAALLGSYADIWMLAGGTVCASADDAWDDFDLEMPETAVNLGGTKKLSLERLLSAKPDLVLASTNTPQHLEWKDALTGAGITVAYFDVSDFDDYLRMLKTCTEITGDGEAYEQYGMAVKAQIDEILSDCKEKMKVTGAQTVLVMRASATSIRAKNSEGNVLGEMLKHLGCINIADSNDSLLENLSIESILLANPDRMFIVQSGDDIEGTKKKIEAMFRDNPLWQELDAVKNGQIYYMDKRLYNLKPNARWGEAYEELERILFPEN